nr:hypothetical protein [uncultured Flavobacterium sp.]
MKKFHIVLLIILGMFLMPDNAIACGIEKNQKEKSCCSKENSEPKTEKKSCCGTDSDSEKGCGGKCGHSNCTFTSIAYFSLITFNEIEIKNNLFVVTDKKHDFFHKEANISSGFHSLWLIPKIS